MRGFGWGAGPVSQVAKSARGPGARAPLWTGFEAARGARRLIEEQFFLRAQITHALSAAAPEGDARLSTS